MHTKILQIIFFVMCFFLVNSCKYTGKADKINKVAKSASQDLNSIDVDTISKSAPTNSKNKNVSELEEDSKILWTFKNGVVYLTNGNPLVGEKIIDQRKLNPYKNWEYQIEYMSPDSTEYQFNLSNLSKTEVDKMLNGSKISPDALIKDPYYLKAVIGRPNVATSDSMLAIGYQVTFYSNKEDILCTQGFLKIINYLGEEVNTIEDRQDGFKYIKLSPDGKYLMQKYGMNYGEDGSGQLDTGFKFYDLENGKMVFEWNLGREKQLVTYNLSNTHATYLKYAGKSIESYVIDYSNQNVYMKEMDRRKFMDSKEYRNTVLKNFRKSYKIVDLLKDDFQKVN